MAERYDVIVVGGGFAGVTAARECALRGRRTLLLEARDRLGGRTWSAQWNGVPTEYGGALGAWPPAAPLRGADQGGAFGHGQRGRRSRSLARRQGAPHGHDRGTGRHRS